MTLSGLVNIAGRFQRAIRIDTDMHSEDALEVAYRILRRSFTPVLCVTYLRINVRSLGQVHAGRQIKSRDCSHKCVTQRTQKIELQQDPGREIADEL